MLEIFVGAEGDQRVGRIGLRLGERPAVLFAVEECLHLLTGDFLLVQRTQHEHRCPGVFERPHAVEIVPERPGSDNQRMGQPHPEVPGPEIHYPSFESGGTGSSVAVGITGTVMPASC